jgi:hypothetical protein
MQCARRMLKAFYSFWFYFQDITFPVKVQTVKAKLAQHIFFFLGMYAMVQNKILPVLFKNGVMAGAYGGAVGAG